MVAHRELGELAWRRRQMVWISFSGRVRVLGMSRKEERVLMPGGVALISVVGNRGAGGGGGNGDEAMGDSGGVGGKVGIGICIADFFLMSWILSLYASFSSLISRRPSLFRARSVSAIPKSKNSVCHMKVLLTLWLSCRASLCISPALYPTAASQGISHHEPAPTVSVTCADTAQHQRQCFEVQEPEAQPLSRGWVEQSCRCC